MTAKDNMQTAMRHDRIVNPADEPIITAATDLVPPQGYYGSMVAKPPRVDNYEAPPTNNINPNGPYYTAEERAATGMTGDEFRNGSSSNSWASNAPKNTLKPTPANERKDDGHYELL